MVASNLTLGTFFFLISALNKEMKQAPAYFEHHDDRRNGLLIIVENLLLVWYFLDTKCDSKSGEQSN